MDPVVICKGLSKRYVLGEERDAVRTLRELVIALPRRRPGAARHAREEIWALQDLDLEIKEGEVLGFVGRNGAGKSTLLKILARITEPTRGRARVRGRVGALLEVGTAFDSELTGRENVLINGALLGLSRRDIVRKFDEIVEFSGVGDFIDTPVKRYSSGMYLRLGFAVAAHLEPDIMVVDEVLAVGDAEFQRRCLGRMTELGREGRTVVYVSHDLGSLLQLTSRCVWLDRGRIRADGEPEDIIGRYLRDGVPAPEELMRDQDGPVRLVGAELRDGGGHRVETPVRDDDITVHLVLEVDPNVSRPDFSVYILDELGRRIIDEAYLDDQRNTGTLDAPGRHVVELHLPTLLRPGRYTVGVWLGAQHETFLESDVLRFEVGAAAVDRPEALSRARLVQPAVRWSHRRDA